ncbi:hypothetical protein [Streptomyces griseorubiginosus]|uniref:DUF7878 domain-containing protein n=1 Tax=Streptomyces griseorubiginosus TaxID=67304 RepID=UPI002E81C942|nr:hypothetical protein [Streptomyces griseorubiginosus]WUB46190.1 hypothetical protein OHN19_23795 [Streptomyces griseorubiginosus]WUB54711.1 hypothetical protein OG942_23795 [Streptomyces griseorubiginosus]
MILSYTNFTTQDLRGDSVEQLFTNIEADLRVVDGDRVIYAEVLFPVAELAAELSRWLGASPTRSADFELDSMSFAEKGAVRIVRGDEGWRFGSVFSPDVWGRPLDDGELQAEIREFAARVRSDVTAAGIDPGFLDAENRG